MHDILKKKIYNCFIYCVFLEIKKNCTFLLTDLIFFLIMLERVLCSLNFRNFRPQIEIIFAFLLEI